MTDEQIKEATEEFMKALLKYRRDANENLHPPKGDNISHCERCAGFAFLEGNLWCPHCRKWRFA